MNEILNGCWLLDQRRDSLIQELSVGEFSDLMSFIIDERLQQKSEPSELVKFFNFTEAAEILRISGPSLRKAIKTSEINCRKIGGRILFSIEDLKNKIK